MSAKLVTLVQNLGYYLPWILGGSAITTIGYGLLSLLTPTTSSSYRIGIQVFYGIGCGCAATGVSTPFLFPIYVNFVPVVTFLSLP